uniref:Glycosyl hydrolase family 30 TIM-barrel domain-containing protein n=1 Tax=Acrobeloides nanus TaxID=290746 RepID=A0A914DMA6_9BILA
MFGDWARGVAYASNIIEDFQNWVTGWMDFGMFVGEADGDDSPIIINKTI